MTILYSLDRIVMFINSEMGKIDMGTVNGNIISLLGMEFLVGSDKMGIFENTLKELTDKIILPGTTDENKKALGTKTRKSRD